MTLILIKEALSDPHLKSKLINFDKLISSNINLFNWFAANKFMHKLTKITKPIIENYK